MDSYVKIKSSLNKMEQNFNKSNSKYYYIKYYNGTKNYKNDKNEPIVFECLIRHNEIGNRKIERSSPYTFETLESTLKQKCKEYEEEQKEMNELIKDYINRIEYPNGNITVKLVKMGMDIDDTRNHRVR